MKTRDKILAKSQELFNSHGLGKVSVRNICEALGISLGNFTYYFPSKQKIVVELYNQMISELEAVENKISITRESIIYFLEYHRQIFIIQNQYKFFYLHTFELLHQHAEIKNAYLAYTNRLKIKEKNLFHFYSEKGVLQKKTSLDFFERLISTGLVVNSFWIIQAELEFTGDEEKKLIYYLNLCCSLIEPHLTPLALQEYKSYFNNL